ncbi:hypothetical protein MCOR02_001835 [Pyricularia oryzae]|uniref:RING-type domain-containing protein n=3 Tax=Pyricularia oryzae TaxID=318829 RepID=A0A4P7N0W9_PYROR|nr:hypothetical protein OOU_Y34scaffold00240g32 [Pyricularia oryzae Y34]KAH8837142.1 hypothetical protein MCOR01_010781 [Pyricularia oryzae]KAH9438197.1 hypothetical protein MCOR02_001835 [Pyricularia oryzae]KAI6373882.1 hypothetical protein MCOR31_002984 [Pyricularia oryzae]KAI6404560.1 hypothetical protein MCOR23_003003 [Pyricularia oryzae]
MANVEASSPFRSSYLEAAARHLNSNLFDPQSPPPPPPPQLELPQLPPQSAPAAHDGQQSHFTRRRRSRASSPWILTAFSDFSDIDLTSPSTSTLRTAAPQYTPVLPPPLPTPELQLISLSTIATTFPQDVSESILSLSPVSLPSLSNSADRLPRFHPQRPFRPLPIANPNDNDDAPEADVPFMSVRESLRIDRLVSSRPKSPPPPRSQSSRFAEAGSSSSSSSNPFPATESRTQSTVKPEATASNSIEISSLTEHIMPASTRSRVTAPSGSNSSPPSASESTKLRAPRRSQGGASDKSTRPRPGAEEDEDEDEWEQPLAKRRRLGQANTEVIDLVDAETAPAPPKATKPKSANQIRLSNLQCSICMDDMTCLTSTHCGHLFCGGCLHSALHVNATKRVCPICRQKIELVPTSGARANKVPTKGFWPLSLKIMTATRKGKTKEAGV